MHQCQCLDVKYTLAFSPSFLLLYSLKTSSKTPNFSYFKTNNLTMTLPFGKPTSIQNRQLTVLPFARKFPCKRKFWYLQGKMQGNKIDKELARKSSLKQGN
jgi:hypothetical protein